MKHYLRYIMMIGSLFSFHSMAKDVDYTSYYKNGQAKMTGTLRDGLKEGQWTFWDDEGNKTQEAHYKNGDKHGPATSWLYQEYLITAQYKDDLLHGEFRSEDIKTKAPITYGRFENNEREGEWYFGPTRYRKAKEIRHYIKGVKQ